MIVLDENIPESQRQLLARRRIRCHQIGVDFAEKGIQDDAIPSRLIAARRPTFFTRDLRFYAREARHSRYCIVILAVGRDEVAAFVQRFLRHPALDTQARRLGSVVRVSSAGIRVWRLRVEREELLVWN